MTTVARVRYIKRRARELAWSGRYFDHTEIEAELIGAGYPEATTLFATFSVQDRLARICDQARGIAPVRAWSSTVYSPPASPK